MHFLTCCFGCLTLLGCRNSVLRRLAFFPPDPPSYIVLVKGREATLQMSSGSESPEYEHLSISLLLLHTERGHEIPALYFQHVCGAVTLIFSHGNSSDIGLLQSYIADLAIQLSVNILLYEYSGYGQSTGRPSEKNMQADIQAAYTYLTEVVQVDWNNIILFGQSIGSGPTCYLAAQVPVGGVVLVSPIASGLRLFHRTERTPWFDLFKNLEEAEFIRCPCFIIHGTEDAVVPVTHGEWIQSKLQLPIPPWWVLGAHHDDIEKMHRREFFSKLRSFISSAKDLQKAIGNQAELLRKFTPGPRRESCAEEIKPVEVVQVNVIV